MAEKPILFSGPMVRAILDGRKMQTRRVLKPLPRRTIFFDAKKSGPEQFQEPRIAPGNLLWVRETFRGAKGYDKMPPSKWGNKPIWYAADGNPDPKLWWHLSSRNRPGIHMPRWASRITLKVTAVKVERLQDISEEDAKAEGATPQFCEGWPSREYTGGFYKIWTSINGPGSWDANPFVAAYSFERVK